jgi:outer membrane receptor protein involved in Fe transport
MANQSQLAVAVRASLRRAAATRRGTVALSLAAAGLQLTTVGTTALAQAKPELEEIVVTATRREQTLQDIPFNISAVTGDTLEKSNISDAVEALRTMPGISIQDRGFRNGGIASGIVIRGINVDGGFNGDVPLAAPPTVATYVDDTALFGNFILKDIERVEVLRGPQGTLYGSGSLAGNVRYIMRKPDTTRMEGSASINFGVTEGSDGYNFNPDLMLNLPFGEAFAFRMNAGMIDNDGIVDYPNAYRLDSNGDPVVNGDVETALPEYHRLTDVDTVDIKYARGSLLYAPGDSFQAQLSYQWQKDEVGGRRQVTSGDNLVSGGTYDDYEFGGIQAEPSEREVKLTSLELEMDFGFATLTSATSYYDHTGNGISDNSGVYARNGWFAFYGSSPRPIAQAERFYDESAFAQEFRLVSKGGEFIDWTAGIYYMDQDYDLGQNSYLVGYLPYLNAIDLYGFAPYTTNQDFLFRREQAYEEIALFGEVTINFTEDWHLTLGGRYFDNEVDVDALVDIPIWKGTAYEAPAGVAAKTISDNDFLFKANLAWDVTADSMLYATYSQGYRHAGANAVPTTGKYGENPDFFTFAADTVDNFEVGYKGVVGLHSYSVSVYYTDWQDPQLNTATPNWGFFAAINGDSARSQGIELELSGPLAEHLNYSLGYTYADSELTADVWQPAGNLYGGPVYEDKVGRDGDRLPGSAQNVFNVSLTYDMVFDNGMTLDTVLSGYYQSGVVNSLGDDNCFTVYNAIGNCRDSASPTSAFYAPDSVFSRQYAEIDGFSLWNLSANLAQGDWGFSFYVKNLFNDEGTTGAFTFLSGGSNTSPLQNYYGNNSRDYIALPRTIGAMVSYRF